MHGLALVVAHAVLSLAVLLHVLVLAHHRRRRCLRRQLPRMLLDLRDLGWIGIFRDARCYRGLCQRQAGGR